MKLTKIFELVFCIIGIGMLCSVFATGSDTMLAIVFLLLSLAVFEVLYTIKVLFTKEDREDDIVISKQAKKDMNVLDTAIKQFMQEQPQQRQYQQPFQQPLYQQPMQQQQQPQYQSPTVQQPIANPIFQPQTQPIYQQYDTQQPIFRQQQPVQQYQQPIQQQPQPVYQQPMQNPIAQLDTEIQQKKAAEELRQQQYKQQMEQRDVPPIPPISYRPINPEQEPPQNMPTREDYNNASEGNESNNFVCDVCGRECSGVFGLRTHQRLKHNIQYKK